MTGCESGDSQPVFSLQIFSLASYFFIKTPTFFI